MAQGENEKTITPINIEERKREPHRLSMSVIVPEQLPNVRE